MTYDIEITWKEGATEDEIAEGNEFVKEVTKELEENTIPTGVKAIKIMRAESYSAEPVK